MIGLGQDDLKNAFADCVAAGGGRSVSCLQFWRRGEPCQKRLAASLAFDSVYIAKQNAGVGFPKPKGLTDECVRHAVGAIEPTTRTRPRTDAYIKHHSAAVGMKANMDASVFHTSRHRVAPGATPQPESPEPAVNWAPAGTLRLPLASCELATVPTAQGTDNSSSPSARSKPTRGSPPATPRRAVRAAGINEPRSRGIELAGRTRGVAASGPVSAAEVATTIGLGEAELE